MEGILNFLRTNMPEVEPASIDPNSPLWKTILLKYLLEMKKKGFAVKELDNNGEAGNAHSPVRFLRVY